MQLRSRSCPLCGQTIPSQTWAESNFTEAEFTAFSFASRKIPEGTHFRIVRCTFCDILYSTPAPPLDWLEIAYRSAHYDSAEEASYAAHTYIKLLTRVMPNLSSLESALDIGAGDGAFLECLRQSGVKNIMGIEPSGAPIQMAEDSIRPFIKSGMFSAEDFTPGSFNLITCFQTVEHVDDPLAICKDSLNLLKQGGAFFVVAHNYRALLARILGTKSPIFDVEHLQLNSPKSLRLMLEQAGYEKIKIWSIANTYPLHYWLKLLPLNSAFKIKFITLLKSIGLGRLLISLRAGNIAAIGFKSYAQT